MFELLARAGFRRDQIARKHVGRLHYLTVGSVAALQGWKLHVSSRAEGYVELIERLLAEAALKSVPCKLAADPTTVQLINDGHAGMTQVGKIVTFYPASDAEARALGGQLTQLLEGWRGPVIENELRLRLGAPVFARYGAFQRRVHRTRIGLQMEVIEARDGELVPDLRGTQLHEALGIDCPFVGADVMKPPAIVGERFVLVGLMAETRHSKIFHAVDLEECSDCLVKLVRRHASVDRRGRDAADRLGSEYELLRDLRMPELTAVRALHVDHDWAALAMTRFEGVDLVSWRRGLAAEKVDALRTVASNVVAALYALHSRGVIMGDLNPRNIIVNAACEAHFVDLEFACQIGSCTDSTEFGTHGYLAPDLASGAPLSPRHDLYSLAAILFFLASGVELSLVPRSDLLLRESGQKLPRDPWRHVHELLLSATDESAAAVLAAARELFLAAGPEALSMARGEGDLDGETLKGHVERTALAVLKLATLDDGHLGWTSRHPATRDQRYLDLHLGDAGIALGLLRMGLAVGAVDVIESALSAADAVWHKLSEPGHQPLPGLFIGDGGAALLFLSLHEVLGTPDWLERAAMIARRVATLACPSPDLMHGLAGRGLVQLWLHEYTQNPSDLANALKDADALAQMARVGSSVEWAIPEGYGELSGRAHHGIAHGSAGIAYFLNELLRVEPLAPVAGLLDGVLGTLARARAHNPVIGAVDWPHAPGGNFRGGVWCHGSAGIAQLFSRVYQRTANVEMLRLAEQAARAAVLQAQWLGPTQCHGLAGLVEVLLDLHRATGDEVFVGSARELGAHLLRYFTVDTEFGPLASSERHDVFTAELMVGAAGAAASLARLVDVGRLGSLLMPPREAFRPIYHHA